MSLRGAQSSEIVDIIWAYSPLFLTFLTGQQNQVQRELEEERKVAEQEAARAQLAIEAKQAELAAIEATRKREVRTPDRARLPEPLLC